MIRIKKYKNRHLYLNGQYITFKALDHFIKEKQSFVILSHETGENVTNETLREMLLDSKYHFTSKAIMRIISDAIQER